MPPSQPVPKSASDAYRQAMGSPVASGDVPGDPSAEVNLPALVDALKQAQEEIRLLKNQLGNQQADQTLTQLEPEAARDALMADPVGFVRAIVDAAAKVHLTDLKEQAELRGALLAFRRANPEFAKFEAYVLPLVAELIQTDPDGVIDPWQTLLEKAFSQFKARFSETLKNTPELLASQAKSVRPDSLLEGNANRIQPEAQPNFTREQIARMSLDEFIRNEKAINQALKQGRIA
jgi:hypothetical protein